MDARRLIKLILKLAIDKQADGLYGCQWVFVNIDSLQHQSMVQKSNKVATKALKAGIVYYTMQQWTIAVSADNDVTQP